VNEQAADSPPHTMPRPSSRLHGAYHLPKWRPVMCSWCVWLHLSAAIDRMMSQDAASLPERLPRGWRVAWSSKAAPVQGVKWLYASLMEDWP
jgi:hypothetical protein